MKSLWKNGGGEGGERKKRAIFPNRCTRISGGWRLGIGLAPQVMGCALKVENFALKVVNLLRVCPLMKWRIAILNIWLVIGLQQWFHIWTICKTLKDLKNFATWMNKYDVWDLLQNTMVGGETNEGIDRCYPICGHLWLLKLKFLNWKCSFSVTPATFQVLISHMWLAATMLDSTNMEHFHHCRKSHWTALVCGTRLAMSW